MWHAGISLEGAMSRVFKIAIAGIPGSTGVCLEGELVILLQQGYFKRTD